jgi:hypothetical protein
MRASLVVVENEGVEIILQFLERVVPLFTKCLGEKLVFESSVKAFDKSICPRARRAGHAVLDVLRAKVELVKVPIGAATVLSSTIGENRLNLDSLLSKNGNTFS